MQGSFEIINVSSLSRKIMIKIPANNIINEIHTKAKKLTKEVHLKGFRPGHVPIKLILDKYGNSLREEVINTVMDQTLKQALTEHDLTPIGEIKLEHISDFDKDSSTDLTCEFSLEVYPKVEIELEKLNILMPKVEITTADIDQELLEVRKEFAEIVEVNRAAKLGDLVKVEYHGELDELSPEQSQELLTGIDSTIELGKEQYINGLAEALLGVTAGQEINLLLTYPEDYLEQILAGKTVSFKIKVKQVAEFKLPEVNADFAKTLGLTNQTPEGINEHIKLQLEKRVANLAQSYQWQQIKSQLLINNPLPELPESLVKAEEQELIKSLKRINKSQGILIKNLNKEVKQDLRITAQNNIHELLLLKAILKYHKVNVDQQVIEKKMNQMNTLFGKYKDKDQKFYNRLMQSMVQEEIMGSIINYIFTKVNKTEQPLTLLELTQSKL